MQDEGSQLITLLTGAAPGEIVIDTCTGNGGKTRESEAAHGKGGATNIKTLDFDKLQEYSGMADCVFIDAPCSGSLPHVHDMDGFFGAVMMRKKD